MREYISQRAKKRIKATRKCNTWCFATSMCWDFNSFCAATSSVHAGDKWMDFEEGSSAHWTNLYRSCASGAVFFWAECGVFWRVCRPLRIAGIIFSLCGRYKQNLFTPRLLHLRAWLRLRSKRMAEKHAARTVMWKTCYLFAAQQRKSSMGHTCVCAAPPLISLKDSLSHPWLPARHPHQPSLCVYTSLGAKSTLAAMLIAV